MLSQMVQLSTERRRRTISGQSYNNATDMNRADRSPLCSRAQNGVARQEVREEKMSSTVNPPVVPPVALEPYQSRGFISPGFIASAALLIGSMLVAAYRQQEWEFPLVRALNTFARHSMLLDRTMHALTTRDLLQGVPFIGLIWFLWFAGDDTAPRARLLVGTIAASFAGVLSRIIQIELPTHLRPLHQAQLGFVLPFGVEPDALNHFNSFPSDHGAVFFTLCAVIWRERPQLGMAAFAWAAIIDFARVYEGFHFPSDVIGSIAVGLLILYMCQPVHGVRAVSRALAFAQNRAAWFYLAAFVMTYQIATLFDDLREIGRGMSAVLLHHDVFNGS
jgi:undecaprenyl-diphosphatase